MVHPVVHVAQHNVGLGAVSGMKHLHTELFASDSSSYQSRIKNDGFHKAVLGAPKHLILFGFFHPAGGIGSGVNQKALVIPVDKQRKYAGHDKISDLRPLILQINLHIGKIGL